MMVDKDIQLNMKSQRLRALQAQYYEFLMNKVAYEANDKKDEADEMSRKMDECDKSYTAVKSLEITEVEESVPDDVETKPEGTDVTKTQGQEEPYGN